MSALLYLSSRSLARRTTHSYLYACLPCVDYVSRLCYPFSCRVDEANLSKELSTTLESSNQVYISSKKRIPVSIEAPQPQTVTSNHHNQNATNQPPLAQTPTTHEPGHKNLHLPSRDSPPPSNNPLLPLPRLHLPLTAHQNLHRNHQSSNHNCPLRARPSARQTRGSIPRPGLAEPGLGNRLCT